MTAINPRTRRNRPLQRQPPQAVYCLRLIIGVALVGGIVVLWRSYYNAQDNMSTTTTTTTAGLEEEDSSEHQQAKAAASHRNKTVPVVMEPDIPPTPPPPPRVLIFDGNDPHHPPGQGTGELVHGLLAAQMLGLEYDRPVCVRWSSFERIFDYVETEHAQLCEVALNHPATVTAPVVQVWDIASTPTDECELAQLLESMEHRVVVFHGNMYPGWPGHIPPDLFPQHYRPKPALLESLPYGEKFPQTVVHLRTPDDGSPKDPGLDDEALFNFGEMVHGEHVHLITNRPDLYVDRFHDCCGWTYDKVWGENKRIEDSARRGGRVGGEEGGGDDAIAVAEMTDDQNVKQWADWYTIMRANHVYYTNSDFSRSAVHWNAKSIGYQLGGMRQVNAIKDGKLTTTRAMKMDKAPYERARQDKKTVPALSGRRFKDSSVPYTRDDCEYLRNCQNPDKHKKNHKGLFSKITQLRKAVNARVRAKK